MFTYQLIFSRIPFPCQYEDQGCKVVVKQEERSAHEEACPKRLVQCGKARCKKLLPLSQLAQHWTSYCYKSTEIAKMRMGTVINMLIWFRAKTFSTAFLLADKTTGQEFFFIKVHFVYKGFYYLWLFVNCTPEESSRFTAEAYLDHDSDIPTKCPTGQKSQLPVISIDIALKYIIHENLALKLMAEEFIREPSKEKRSLPWRVNLVNESQSIF